MTRILTPPPELQPLGNPTPMRGIPQVPTASGLPISGSKLNYDLDCLIEDARLFIREHSTTADAQAMRSLLSPAAFSREFETVRLSVGRQVGKTCYIASHVNPDDVVIVANTSLASSFRHILAQFQPNITPIPTVLVASAVLTGAPTLFGINKGAPQVVYVDDASLIQDVALDRMYSLFADDAISQQFILLG